MKLEIFRTEWTSTRDQQNNKIVEEIGCLSIKLLVSPSTEDQTMHITFDFSGTELKARAHFNHDRSENVLAIVDFL